MNSDENIKQNDIQNEERLRFFLDGTIDETTDDVVVVPRDEYDEMVSECTILRVIETLLRKQTDSYHLLDYLRIIIDMGEDEAAEPEKPAASAMIDAMEDDGK